MPESKSNAFLEALHVAEASGESQDQLGSRAARLVKDLLQKDDAEKGIERFYYPLGFFVSLSWPIAILVGPITAGVFWIDSKKTGNHLFQSPTQISKSPHP
jgi:hypothetical protein